MSESSGEALRKAFERVHRHDEGEERDTEEQVQILSFALSEEWYGFRLPHLVEIIGGVEPTVIPFTPDYIPGVINHRGSIVSVVDLKKVFGLTGRYRGPSGRIVLVKSEGSVVAFQADAISDVVTVRASQLEPPLSTIEKVKADYIEACIRLERGLLVLLDSHALTHELKVGGE